jgi:ubiquinone/menaquinone biosynthesis C-methylase UbiE
MIIMESGKLELDRTKEGVKKYWDYGSKFYDTAPGIGGDEERRMWKELLSGTVGPSPKNVLDVGSGTGIIAMHLAELGHSVTAVDFSEGMMDVARKKALAKGANIRFMEGDVENLNFEDGTFDCVTARYVLWTLPHPEKAVKEWARVVKPGGRVTIIDGKWVTRGLLSCVSAVNYHIYRFIKYGKNPFTYDYKKDISIGLPNPHGVEKKQVVEYMSKAGLANIAVTDLKTIRDIQRKQLPWYFKYANDHPIFMVRGIAVKKR